MPIIMWRSDAQKSQLSAVTADLGLRSVFRLYGELVTSICSFQATFLLRGAELAPRDRNDDGGVGVAYAALSASGADDPLVLDAAASIFPQIAAMKADRPTSRKIRAMPAWISPAGRGPGARQGAGWARPARRAGSGKASICGIAYATASTVTQRISA